MADVPLYRGALFSEHDVVTIRLRTQVTADALGLSILARTRSAAAVSELARAAYASGQELLVTLAVANTPRGASLQVRFDSPAGPLSGELAAPGHTLRTVEQLVDSLTVEATAIVLDQFLPSPATDTVRATIRSRLAAEPTLDPVAALSRHNEELTVALLAVQEREAGLARLNAELEQTNRGVVALYAELEERAYQIRKAQRDVFEELGRALRPPAPVVSYCQLEVRYLPAQENSPTGGDLYDWLVLPNGDLHICVVDAVGHGVASTRDALDVTHAIRTLTLEGHPLAEVLARADELLQRPGSEVMATAQLARLRAGGDLLTISGAGHPPALVLTASAAPRYLDTDGRPLGYPGGGGDSSQEVALAAGDIVLLYTDGVVEQTRDIEEGMAALAAAALAALPAANLAQFVDDVLAALNPVQGWRDDAVLLAIKRA